MTIFAGEWGVRTVSCPAMREDSKSLEEIHRAYMASTIQEKHVQTFYELYIEVLLPLFEPVCEWQMSSTNGRLARVHPMHPDGDDSRREVALGKSTPNSTSSRNSQNAHHS